MQKWVYELDTVDEMGRVLDEIDVCLYLNELHSSYGDRLVTGRPDCFKTDVLNYLSERMCDLLDEFRGLASECECADLVEVKTS